MRNIKLSCNPSFCLLLVFLIKFFLAYELVACGSDHISVGKLLGHLNQSRTKQKWLYDDLPFWDNPCTLGEILR
jgi:hypothetical protein